MRKISVISLICLLVQIDIVCAKVWLLPDYQREQFYSHRVNDEQKERPKNNDDGGDFSCSDYSGLLPLSAIGGDITCSDYFYGP